MSNTVAVRWMEQLRVKMMSDHFSDVDAGDPSNLSVIAKTDVNYLRPIAYGDSIIGSVWVNMVMRSRWEVGFSFISKINGQQTIVGTQIGAFLSPISLLPTRVPQSIADKFKNYC
nr:thioesterase family protein [Curvibacter sp. AEP1-3]